MREVEEGVDSLRHIVDEMSRCLELQTKAERMGGFGFISRNLENDEIWMSEGTYKIFGLRRKSKLAQDELIAAVVHPEDVDFVTEALATAIAGASMTSSTEWSIQTGKSGSSIQRYNTLRVTCFTRPSCLAQ